MSSGMVASELRRAILGAVRPWATPALFSGASARFLTAALLVGLTLLAYGRFIQSGFGATDSLPLVETSRIQSLVDVPLQFTRPVMAGTSFALGEVVYRPFVSITFGLDYAVWGMQAAGYHITN